MSLSNMRAALGFTLRSSRPMAFAAIALAAGAMLGACSFQPVYSGASASQPNVELAYAEPNSRLEQVIYQELALRLGTSPSATSPLASVSVSTGSGGLAAMTDSPSPNAPASVSVTATLTIAQRDGSMAQPIKLTRTATAQYTTNNQVLANTTAASEAAERAAKAAAESLRLAVLAALMR